MCDSVNNNSTETICFVRETWLADAMEDKVMNDGHIILEMSKEYQVTLEKIWGTVGLQIEVCISQKYLPLLCYGCQHVNH
jgi:hypothetical protein